MHIQKSKRKKTIFKQFIVAFISIIIPIVLCGVLLVVWQTDLIQRGIEENARANVNYGINRLEAQVFMVKRLQNNLINDKDLKNFLRYYNKVPVYDYYTMASDVMERIKIVKEGNECIEDVSIYFRDVGIAIDANSGYRNMMQEEYKRMSDSLVKESSSVFWDENEIYTLLRYSLVKVDGRTEYIIKINFSRNKLFQEYLIKDLDRDNYVFAYDGDKEKFVYISQKEGEELAPDIRFFLEQGNSMQKISWNGQQYLMVSGYSEELRKSVGQCIPMTEITHVRNRFYGILFCYLILSVSLAFFFPHSVRRIVNRPIYQLIGAFKEVEKGNLDTQINDQASDEFHYLYREFNFMVDRLNHLIDENYKSRLYAQKAELKQMQAQISPHFLYNAYFMLHRMILDEDMENAANLSRYLGNYMEYITHNTRDEVPLSQELAHIQSYLEIQCMRFGRRMRVEIQEPPAELSGMFVPRLILQPVIENYLKYGYEISEGEGALYIRFEISRQNKSLNNTETVCSIIVGGGCTNIEEQVLQELENRLDRKSDAVEVTGLVNVHRRLQIRFGDSSGILLSRDADGRLVTCLQIVRKEDGK